MVKVLNQCIGTTRCISHENAKGKVLPFSRSGVFILISENFGVLPFQPMGFIWQQYFEWPLETIGAPPSLANLMRLCSKGHIEAEVHSFRFYPKLGWKRVERQQQQHHGQRPTLRSPGRGQISGTHSRFMQTVCGGRQSGRANWLHLCWVSLTLVPWTCLM